MRSLSDAPVASAIFEVSELSVAFVSKRRSFTAVEGLSFRVPSGRTLGIVGESGSGKSITALSIMRLLPKNARITAGTISLAGEDLATKSDAEMRAIRGARIAMIFQDPMTSLNPVISVGEQIAETVRLHRKLGAREAWNHAIEMLRIVHIPDAERRVHDYPHHFSGGMRQRVMIAMALSCEPDVLIADEPTTALDVTIQAQILELMQEMQERLGMAIILITHDLGVVAQTCDDVLVMYGGTAVEYASAQDVFGRPAMPYTRGLLASLPRIDADPAQMLHAVEGHPPSLTEIPTGCVFAPRCPERFARCDERPELVSVGDTHLSRCWLSYESGR